jgi:hypothetical protein
MTISINVSEEPDNRWNERLVTTGFGTIYQSKEIAQHFRNNKQNPIFLQFIDNKGNIVGQILIRDHFRIISGAKGKFIKKFFGKKKICEWAYGPIVFNEYFKNEIYEQFGNFLLKKKYTVSGVENPLSPSGVTSIKNNFNITPWKTFLIDLTQHRDILYQNISKHNGRKNIERSEKRGVIIEEINEHSLEEYCTLGNQSMGKSNNGGISYENLLNYWKINKSLGYSGFLARKDGECIGGLLFSFFCGHIIEGGVVRSKLDLDEHLYSQDLIKWKIITWGNENKMKFYNLAGFNPNPQSKKEE